MLEKDCFPIFMTIRNLLPYYNFYENVLKPIFHNFKSLYVDLTDLENAEHWKEYQSLNLTFSQKIVSVKNLHFKDTLK